MQIAATFRCPLRSAAALDDRRARKLLVEAAQILCTALRANGCDLSGLYKARDTGQAVVEWPKRNRANYDWLVDHYEALCLRYRLYSGGRVHLTELKLPAGQILGTASASYSKP